MDHSVLPLPVQCQCLQESTESGLADRLFKEVTHDDFVIEMKTSLRNCLALFAFVIASTINSPLLPTSGAFILVCVAMKRSCVT